MLPSLVLPAAAKGSCSVLCSNLAIAISGDGRKGGPVWAPLTHAPLEIRAALHALSWPKLPLNALHRRGVGTAQDTCGG